MAETKLPTHVKCPHCKHEMALVPWVYAHWDEALTAQCENCKKKYIISGGRVLGKDK